MKTTFKIIILVLFAALSLASCSHEICPATRWQETKVTADGKITEWPDPLQFLDDKTKISYAITNDRQNLYLCMRIADPATKMKIVRGGMEFRIDTLGKKKFPVSFGFPVANQMVLTHDLSNNHYQEEMPNGRPPRREMKQKILSPASEVQLAGFKQPHNGIVSLLGNTAGISAAITIDSSGMFCYEAVIPFSTFYKRALSPTDTTLGFNFQIKINALPPPDEADRRAESAEAGGEMEGGHHGGGMQPGGMGGGGMNQGGGHKGGGQHYQTNSDLYSASLITRKMKLGLK